MNIVFVESGEIRHQWQTELPANVCHYICFYRYIICDVIRRLIARLSK